LICHTPFQLVMPRPLPIRISEELAEFTGLKADTEYPIVEVIRHVYEYIEANHLTDKNDPRIIVCDEKLKKLLNYDPATARTRKDGTPEILNHLNISRYLERHFIRNRKKKEKSLKNDAGEMNNPLIKISSELAEFTGLETETEYSVIDVIRYVHEYIEANHLTDKNDPRIIVCNEKLKKLLNYGPATTRIRKDGTLEPLKYFNMPKYLERHFIKDRKKIKDRLQENDAKEMKNSPLIKISSELAEFTGLKTNTEYFRKEVIRHIREYIHTHELMSKKYPHLIVCDEKLKKLLNYDHMTATIRKDGTPEILNYFNMPKYLERHFIKDRKKKAKNEKNANLKEMEQSESKVERSPGILRLRRCFACMPSSVDQEMKLVFFDLKNISNSDISATSACFRRQTYRHPRARQLAAACKYGWMVTPAEAYAPEEFMSRLSSSTLNFEERARIRNK
jgi:chromatin remodeling complex protein RSC6